MRISDWSSDVCSSDLEFSAYPNACRHRGRRLLDCPKKGLTNFRCPFHGWSWKLDGTLKEVPCHWDFPNVTEETHSLPKVKTGRWGGFVFINPDPAAQPLKEFLGDIDEHWTTLQLGRASCRERVCQYVKIPVVAVDLK